MPPRRKQVPSLVLGIEGGGTRTSVLLVDADDRVLTEFQRGPCNVRMISDAQLVEHLGGIAHRLPVPSSALSGAGIGLAGARTAAEHDRIRQSAARVFPCVPCLATNDLETALAAAPPLTAAARVLVLSGTGSCCFGRAADGRTARVGGRGHVIGDRGSAWDIGQRALREIVAHFDRTGRWPKLGSLILDALALNGSEDLIPWSMQAEKREIAGVAMQAFEAARQGDALARAILKTSAEMLAADGSACAAKLASAGERVQFVFNGGVLVHNRHFANAVARHLRRDWPKAAVTVLSRPSVWGAIELARSAIKPPAAAPLAKRASASRLAVAATIPESIAAGRDASILAASPTEQSNPRSAHLGTMPLADAVDLMLDEESGVPAALRSERDAIVWVVRKIIQAFKSGGRLLYVGAGTSGRLGVLDASECPPTFRAPREQVQGIIAGGQHALWSAVEGAEDDAEAGAEAVRFRNVDRRDVIIGLTASGRTPFVWGALAEANRLRATTVLVAFNPAIKAHVAASARRVIDRVIAVSVGPEVLTGSTRLKAGTATKLLLNIFSTLAMTRVGKVIGNLMVDLNPSNVKLRHRAVRILCQLTACQPDEARSALEKSGWVVKDAFVKLRKRKR